MRWDFLDNSHTTPTPHRFYSGYIVLKAPDETEPTDESTDFMDCMESERMMALISVVSHCKETAVQLETVLRGRGHEVRSVADSQLKASQDDANARETGQFSETSLYIVDLDCDPRDAANTVRALTENPSNALTPVLVAASPESQQQVALACAYGATGLIRKPFSTMETVPDTERALLAASPAK